jgi:hypothetical protein
MIWEVIISWHFPAGLHVTLCVKYYRKTSISYRRNSDSHFENIVSFEKAVKDIKPPYDHQKFLF